MIANVRQTAENAVGVQINGDGATVSLYARKTELKLNQRHLRKLRETPSREIDLLLTELRATDLVGRAADLEALEAWLAAPATVSVRCVIGAAGTGKTRLAIELCERASNPKHASGMKWIAGFASGEELRRFHAAENLADWDWARPTLAVVDDAASCSTILREWLDILAQRADGATAPPLRLLLLERYADPASGGWWGDLMRPGDLSGRGPSDLASPKIPVTLPGLESIGDRYALLSQVMRMAAAIQNLEPAPQPPALGSDPAFDAQLGDDTIDNAPLYLAMAAIVGASAGASAAIFRSRDELAKRIAAREAVRVEGIAASRAPKRFATHLVGCVTLQGGCSLAQAEQLVEEERAAAGYPIPSLSTEEIVALLADIAPRSAGAPGIDAIRPDLIGEAFLLAEIARAGRSQDKQLEIVDRARRRDSDGVGKTLRQTKVDFAHGDPKHPSAVWLAHFATETTGEIREQLKSGTITPDQAARAAWRIGVTMGHWRALTDIIAPRVGELSPGLLGTFAAQRAVAFVETADYPGGLEFSRTMLLNPALPARWRPELFNALGRCLFHLKRYGEAAKVYQSGIDAASPGHPLIAQLYTNLGNALLGDHQNNARDVPAAIEALKKAVRLADDPRMQVESRSGLSTALIDSGRLEEAESVLKEAWSIAQDRRNVQDKARMYVMRNLGVVHVKQKQIARGAKEMDAAIAFGVAHFGHCHPETSVLYESVIGYLANTLTPAELVERALRALQTAQRTCGILSNSAFEYAKIAEWVTAFAIQRAGAEAQLPKIQALVAKQAGRVLDDSAIAALLKFF